MGFLLLSESCCSPSPKDFLPDQQDLSQKNVAIMYMHPSTEACRAQPGCSTGRGLRVKPWLLSVPRKPTLTVSQECNAETYFYLLYIQNWAASPLLQAVLQGNLDAAGGCLELSCATRTTQGCPHPAWALFYHGQAPYAGSSQSPRPSACPAGPCPGRGCIISAL